MRCVVPAPDGDSYGASGPDWGAYASPAGAPFHTVARIA